MDDKGAADSSSTNNDAAEETLRESEVLRRKGKNGEHKRKQVHQKYSEFFSNVTSSNLALLTFWMG